MINKQLMLAKKAVNTNKEQCSSLNLGYKYRIGHSLLRRCSRVGHVFLLAAFHSFPLCYNVDVINLQLFAQFQATPFT